MCLRKLFFIHVLIILFCEISQSQNVSNDIFFDRKFGIYTNVAFVSDYLHRGKSLSDKKPAVQAGTHYRNWLGFYLGGWGSSGSKELPLEIDLYAGYRNKVIGQLELDLKFTQFVYPHKSSNNTIEAMAGIYYSLLGTRYHYDFDLKQHYVELGAENYIYEKFWMMIRAGLLMYSDQFWDYEIRTGYEVNNKLDLFLKYTNHESQGMRISAGILVNVSLMIRS